MKATPLVSAIITTHNRPSLLKRAIDAVKSQTYPSIELIVVDDASDNPTREVCEAEDLVYVRIEKGQSRGANYARNLGVAAAKGKYLAFCDDDDYWLPEKISRQVELIERTGFDLVHCGVTSEFINGTSRELLYGSPDPKSRGDISRLILWNIFFTTSTMLVRREAVVAAGGFDENLSAWQEYELSIRLAQLSPIDFVDTPLVIYRIDINDPNRITNKYYSWKKSVRYILRKHKDLYALLSWKERLKVKRLIDHDAADRCRGARLPLTRFRKRVVVKLINILDKFYPL